MNLRNVLFVVPVFFFIGAFAFAEIYQIEPTPPDGYRTIASSEHPKDWLMFKEDYPTPDRATGDYDGDGKIDIARMWIKTEGRGCLISAYLSSQPDDPEELVRTDMSPWRFAIRTIPPGLHKTHRFYGLGPGGPDSTAVITTETDSINWVWIESEGYVFIWDKTKKEFKRVGMY